MLLTDADYSLLDWVFQHYYAVEIYMGRDGRDSVGTEQWRASTWDINKTWRTGCGITLSDAIKSLIANIHEVESEITVWKPL
jgi:hypothetical protein